MAELPQEPNLPHRLSSCPLLAIVSYCLAQRAAICNSAKGFLLGARGRADPSTLMSPDCKQDWTKAEHRLVKLFSPSLYANCCSSTLPSPWAFLLGPCLVICLHPCSCFPALPALGRQCSTMTWCIPCLKPCPHLLQMPSWSAQLSSASPSPRAGAAWPTQQPRAPLAPL